MAIIEFTAKDGDKRESLWFLLDRASDGGALPMIDRPIINCDTATKEDLERPNRVRLSLRDGEDPVEALKQIYEVLTDTEKLSNIETEMPPVNIAKDIRSFQLLRTENLDKPLVGSQLYPGTKLQELYEENYPENEVNLADELRLVCSYTQKGFFTENLRPLRGQNLTTTPFSR